ncbi:UNVERIFIED_CONTAM: hypothetical protein PYX00_008248 [Menopon gallinae]|uniref:Enoyl-CoA delta isomerase 1, mitochondrial n=1 Tax=Menopon gallinae TaxID=328185 RepID=A0AAW2HMH3_9NEOP
MSILKSFSLWRTMNRASNISVQKSVRQSSTGGENLVDLQVNKETGYAVVTMQRPPVNSMNYDLVNQLLNTFLGLEKSKCKGMILTSASPTVFSAGLDIMEMYKPEPEKFKKFWTALQDMWLHLFSSSYPTVAVINGHSPAGGCLLACSCEYRIMVKGDYTIGLNETQLGIVPPTWFIDTFRNAVPRREAELGLTLGKLYTVDEALKIGMIDEVAADKNEATAKAEKFLNQFKRINYAARAHTKVSVRYEAIKRLQDTREQDLKTVQNFVSSPEVQKGLDMYLQSLKNKAKS